MRYFSAVLILMIMVTGSFYGVSGNPKEIVNNKAAILSINSCSTYDIGCKRLALINNRGSIVKQKAFKVDGNVFAISVDEHMVKLIYNEDDNKLEYIGISEAEGLKDIDRSSFSIFNSFLPIHLKEEETNTSTLKEQSDESEEEITIDGEKKTASEWKNLEEKFQDEQYSKGIPSELTKEHELLMKYQEVGIE